MARTDAMAYNRLELKNNSNIDFTSTIMNIVLMSSINICFN